MKLISTFAGIAVLALAAPAAAVVINGDTTGGPSWNRTTAGAPPTGLSGVGTAVRYQITAFSVAAAGSYNFLSTAGYDNYLHLYQGAFDPVDQFNGVLIANDDFPNVGISGFSFNLNTGTSYLAVASGFANGDFGTYQLSITGPGAVTLGGAVPEPASWAMLIAGFGLAGAMQRRRRRIAA
jgi:hypothetical protein